MKEPVRIDLSFAEGLTGMGAIRDYVRLRRQHSLPEDAILGYFYDKLVTAVAQAAEDDEEGFAMGEATVQLPNTTMTEED